MAVQKLLCVVMIGLLTSVAGMIGAAEKTLRLTGWGKGKPEVIVPRAADVGFREIVVWNHDPKYLKSLVEQGKKHNIEIYCSLYLGDVGRWKKKFPDNPPPLQVMNEEENRALRRIQNDKSKGKSKYQYGGEPFQKVEVLSGPLLCFHHPEVVEYYKAQIKGILAVPGIKGIAFDYFGYRNYRCCTCKRSMELFKKFRDAHADMDEEKALCAFSLESLVDFNNELARYARSANPKAKVITHVYPVFLADQLYGNRLDVDVCCQTAAWFFEPYWSYKKIKSYSRIIFEEEKRFHRRSEGAALIGIYDRPGKKPTKTSERIQKELQAIVDGGGDRIHVCSMNDVLNSERVSRIFKKFFKDSRKQKKPD